MKKAYILSTSFFDFESMKPTIGGMQSYFLDLVPILESNGYETVITSECCDEKLVKMPTYSVLGIQLKGKKYSFILSKAIKTILKPGDLVIYGTDSLINKKIIFDKAVAIQHGVSWDIPVLNKNRRVLRMLFPRFLNFYKIVKRLSYVKNIVCVDYNFVNWYRTLVDDTSGTITIIPNYCKIPRKKLGEPSSTIKIIFARRLCWYRGTRIFLEAILPILQEFDNVAVTIAGEGPDEQFLTSNLNTFKNVDFIKYSSDESVTIHSNYDIAVVPTIGSEGTSLSLLEAMAAQCAVVSSDVGGLTNILINNHNGLIVGSNNSSELYLAIRRLIVDKDLRDKLSINGYKTVCDSFSFERWSEDWDCLLKKMEGKE